MGVQLQRLPDEPWRDVVARIAGKQGLAAECLDLYDRFIAAGDIEIDAAWCALNEWDCLEYVEESPR